MVRPLERADAEWVAALVRQAFAVQPVVLDPPASAAGLSATDVLSMIDSGGGGAVVPVTASVLWAEKAGGLYVGRLAVHPSARRQGLAATLMDAAEREAHRRGLRRLWLSTRLPLVGNRAFFARCGFTETARHAHPGYDAPTFVDMEKTLPG